MPNTYDLVQYACHCGHLVWSITKKLVPHRTYKTNTADAPRRSPSGHTLTGTYLKHLHQKPVYIANKLMVPRSCEFSYAYTAMRTLNTPRFDKIKFTLESSHKSTHRRLDKKSMTRMIHRWSLQYWNCHSSNYNESYSGDPWDSRRYRRTIKCSLSLKRRLSARALTDLLNNGPRLRYFIHTRFSKLNPFHHTYIQWRGSYPASIL